MIKGYNNMVKLIDPFSECFSEAKDFLPGRHLKWLNSFRDNGIKAFSSQGLPTKKWEEWKYTNLNDLSFEEFRRVQKIDSHANVETIPVLMPLEDLSARVVFV